MDDPPVRGLDAAIDEHASRTPEAVALVDADGSLSYAALAEEVARVARALDDLGVRAGERVALAATKRVATVATLFGILRRGAVAVPINPVLKADQVRHILVDSAARVLFAPSGWLAGLALDLATDCPALEQLVVEEEENTDAPPVPRPAERDAVARTPRRDAPVRRSREALLAGTVAAAAARAARPADDTPALILYTSGSTARPKGVVLSHSNLAYGAASVAGYLENVSEDRILALMPLSFDYGLNQVTTALHVGARAVLHDYLVPKGVIAAVARHRITALAAVPHLWNQLARLEWPPLAHLRYVTNTGGRMPVATTRALERRLPGTRIVLMYGFTEAFRSTWLPPAELDRRPESIGRAVPHARVLVVDRDGRECSPDEVGELIHGGPLVALGYWNDAAATRARFRERHADGGRSSDGRSAGGERFAWSGDLVRRDEEGFLYFVSRREDVAKLHGFRVNPAEIEEAVGRAAAVREVSVVCVPHPLLGQAAVAVVVADAAAVDDIGRHCLRVLPRFMVPERIIPVAALPVGPNSKVDRQALRARYATLFEDAPTDEVP